MSAQQAKHRITPNSLKVTMAILLLLILTWLDPGESFYIYGSSLGLPPPYTSIPPPNPYYHQVDQTQLFRNGQWQPLLPYSPLAYLYQSYSSLRTGAYSNLLFKFKSNVESKDMTFFVFSK